MTIPVHKFTDWNCNHNNSLTTLGVVQNTVTSFLDKKTIGFDSLLGLVLVCHCVRLFSPNTRIKNDCLFSVYFKLL